MNILVYSSNKYTQDMLTKANQGNVCQLDFCDSRLDMKTASLADRYDGVCCFVDDDLHAEVLSQLHRFGVKLILLRCTGFNNVDLESAKEFDLTVMRVSDYSPHSVAEFTVGLILNLNRKIHRAYNRVHEGNFLLEGLLGFDLVDKTVGIVGTGKIGTVLAKIMIGFGCRVLAVDVSVSTKCQEMGVVYTDLDNLLTNSDIVSLHLPLTPTSFHLINKNNMDKMKPSAILINTSRGAIIDTGDLIKALKKGRLAGVGLDVYEEESHLFYQNMSDKIITDDIFARLMSFPNVLLTGHQAFFTEEALKDIGETTINNARDFLSGTDNGNCVRYEDHVNT